jgi:hypothetical protein
VKKTKWPYEMPVRMEHIILCRIPEDGYLHSHCRENQKSWKKYIHLFSTRWNVLAINVVFRTIALPIILCPKDFSKPSLWSLEMLKKSFRFLVFYFQTTATCPTKFSFTILIILPTTRLSLYMYYAITLNWLFWDFLKIILSLLILLGLNFMFNFLY